jgi:hypothetical protein
MRYRLRTLMILIAVGPPVLTGVWYGAQRYSESRRADVWEDVGGPGVIDASSISFSMYVDEQGNVYCGPTKLLSVDTESPEER